MTSACYDKQHVCTYLHHFHTRRANSVKITSSRGGTPHSRRTPLPRDTKFRHNKLVFEAAHSEDMNILACTTLIQYSIVTDRSPGHS